MFMAGLFRHLPSCLCFSVGKFSRMLASSAINTPFFAPSPSKALKMEAQGSENIPPQQSSRQASRTLLVKKLTEFATVPTRGSSQAAGYDLYRYGMR